MYNRMVEGRRVAESAERRDGSLGSEGNSHVYMILKAGVSMLTCGGCCASAAGDKGHHSDGAHWQHTLQGEGIYMAPS